MIWNKMFERHAFGIGVGISLFVLMIIGGASAAAITVDDSGGADYTRIQDAVNAASYGDTIYVYDGTYYESLKVYKPLILIGKNKNTTIVDAGGGKKGIEITADDVVINGFTLRNSIDAGIKLSSSSNGSTITNNTIHSIIGSSDSDCIEVTISSHNVISNNEMFDCDDEGIEIDGSSYNTVTNNTIHSITDNAIDLRGSLYNYIANNTIYLNGDDGISLGRSWGVEPIIWGSSHNTITSNDIYLNGGYGIQLTNSSDNDLTYNNISNSDDGINIGDNSSNNSITNNYVFSNNDDGIDMDEYSSKNFVTDNNVFNNSDNGIDLKDSSNNDITKNIIYLNGADGIDLEGHSSYNSITNNKIFDDGTEGININDYSSHNSIINNSIFNNSNDGIHIEDLASNNVIIGNSFHLNGNAGVQIEQSNNNQIYHNNFINNVKQANDKGTNFWDNGYPPGGNYWSDYTGSDANGDSIGDTPYTISGGAGAKDRYPLMNQWGTPTYDPEPTLTPTITPTPTPAPTPITKGLFSDDFSGSMLNSTWTVINKNSDSIVSLTGTGHLQIKASPKNGGSDYYNASNYNAPRILQNANGDWIIETKMSFSPVNNFQGAGIMLCYEDNPDSTTCNRIAERAYYPNAGGSVIRSAGSFVGYTNSISYFRLKKFGNSYTGWFSSDGVAWVLNGNSTENKTLRYVGLFAVRQPWDGNTNVYSDADFDYFDINLISATQPAGTVVSIANTTATPDSNITRAITVENVNNLAAATIWLTYDINVVNVLSVSAGDFGGVTPNIDNTIGKVTMSAFSTTPKSGSIAFANVQLKAAGSLNTTSPLTLTVSSLNDQNGAAIPYTIKNGTFTISSVIKGDVSGDGQITVVDALFIAQYTVGTRTLTSTQLAAADVNGDGQVTIVDALFIAQYTVGLRQL